MRSCSWAELIKDHDTPPAVTAAGASFGRNDTACIIYTSGTGGAPRGVMQHHGAILHNIGGCADVISEDMSWGDEVFLSFLPISHAYEHTGGQMLPIAMGEATDDVLAQMHDAIGHVLEEVVSGPVRLVGSTRPGSDDAGDAVDG